jgi:hypothetical protein
MPNQFMFSGCICCFNGCDFDNIMLCCKGSRECLCLVNEHCLAANVDPYGIGMVTDEGEICKIGLFCCTCGLKIPEVLCMGVTQCLCLVEVQSFPFDPAYVAEPVSACVLFQCLPEVGCAKPWPASSALDEIAASATPVGDVMAR